jgi:phospholipase C
MTDTDRRHFLRLATHAAGAAVTLHTFPASIARALAIPADRRTGTLEDVRHVIILMQENRSFDHYFGTLPGVRGFGDRFTIPLPDGRSVWQQSNGARTVLPYHLDASAGNAQRVTGTPHSWNDAQAAWDHGRLTAWPQYKTDHSMGYYTRRELAFQFALADAFTVCDAYHCSLHGGTNPNRLFLWSATNGPSAARVAAVVSEWTELGSPAEGFEWTTYPERLQPAGVSWKVYQNLPDNFTDNPLAGFRQYRLAAQRLGSPSTGMPTPQYTESMEAISTLLKGVSDTMPDGGFLESFRQDVRHGRLPSVSWIIAPETYCEHPGPSSPLQGAWYVQEVLNALTADPKVWSQCVLFINFDENDGFFDHVPPPAPPSPNPDGSSAGKSTCDVSFEHFTHANPPGTREQPPPDGRPYGMGPRVPMFVISPWSRGGWVNSQVSDHTSVIRFLEKRFGVTEPNISSWRRAVAGDLTSAFNFRNPNAEAFPTLPLLERSAVDSGRAEQEKLAQIFVPDEANQQFPRQPRGIRRSCALPYELHVSGRTRPRDASIDLTFQNTGAATAVFHVYDRLHLDRIPRRYTVEPNRHLSDRWMTGADDGVYDLWVLGPNGFHRSFRGRAPSTDDMTHAEVEARYDTRVPSLELVLLNSGRRSLNLTVQVNAYRNDGPWVLTIPAGRRVRRSWPLAGSGNWYDFTVLADDFERRFAGRLETGLPGLSDPEMGS